MCDLSTCTDYYNPHLGNYIMSMVCRFFRNKPSFPTSLVMLVTRLLTKEWPVLFSKHDFDKETDRDGIRFADPKIFDRFKDCKT
jgi:hypothetical protein